MRARRVCQLVILVIAVACVAAPAASAAASSAAPHYDHVFMLTEENHGYQDIIGNPQAPTLNPEIALAS